MLTKTNRYIDIELQNLAKQLQCPKGEDGVFVARKMSENNMGMIISGILNLKLKNNDTILELGHGEGKHVNKIYAMANDINYYGLDISPLMKNLSIENNKNLHKNISFNLYDGEQIIYKNCFFDKALTVNSIYFFKSPLKILNEVYRVLKPNGTFVIVFADKNFMKTLPFTQYGFQLYDLKDMQHIIKKTDFNISNTTSKSEFVTSKLNQLVERNYHVLKLTKPA